MAGLVMTILVSPLPPVHISWKLKSTYKTALAKLRNQIKFSTTNINRYNKDAKRKAMGTVLLRTRFSFILLHFH